ncbi:MAG: hypothetical protein QOJ92_643 [Frankiales bacterium]|nr:hypothetical protein [Frankiales bacterium]
MTALLPPEVLAPLPAAPVSPDSAQPEDAAELAPLAPLRIALVAALSGSAAAVTLGGLFSGVLAVLVGLAAAGVSAGLVGLASARGKAWLQLLAVPGIFVLGYAAALLLPNATGVTGSVPSLVRQSIANGGLAKPPIPFDPGWRFLLVAVIALITAAATSLAIGYRSPRLAALIPLPLVIAAGLNQAPGREAVSGIVAMGLLLGALAVSSAADLAGRAEVSKAFERRQLLRSLAATVIALAALAGLSRADVLFPKPNVDRSANPQKPKVTPLSAVKDRPLFAVTGGFAGPYRLGTLDSYIKHAWYLPPFEPGSFAGVSAGGTLPDAPSDRAPVTVGVSISGLNGFAVPTPSGAEQLSTSDEELSIDPATGVLRTSKGAASAGVKYALTVAPSPGGSELARASALPPGPDFTSYLAAPPIPDAVAALIAKAPQNKWELLQSLRKALFDHVIAAGAGQPVDVAPSRVVQMLDGETASPYEIVAAEALLARWAGLPSRIGYGFYGGSKLPDGSLEMRPRDGANWLEVHFPGHGWVAVLGHPLKAQPSLDPKLIRKQRIIPSDEIGLSIFVPILRPDRLLAFEIARFYLVRIVPTLIGLYLLWQLVPLVARARRRRKRRAWGLAHGPAGRVAVAYAEFRDVVQDLGLDLGRTTALEFLREVDDDVEHSDLAWLTTRALWGDLVRDLQAADAVAAESLSQSLRRRVTAAQPLTVRLAAITSRTSLRHPYDPVLPTSWPAPRTRTRKAGASTSTWARPLGWARRVTAVVGPVLRRRPA